MPKDIGLPIFRPLLTTAALDALGGRVIPYQDRVPYVDPTATLFAGSFVIGDVVLGEGVNVWYNTVIRGDVHFVRIGNWTNIQDLSMIHVTTKKHPTIVGDGVTVGHKVTLHGCTVHDYALIGMGAIVLDTAIIGEGALVGAGAIVMEGTVIPPHTLAVGSPCKVKRDLTAAERAQQRRIAAHYVDLAESYKTGYRTP